MFWRNKSAVPRNIYSCPKNWDELKGDDFVRQCPQCKHSAYNLTSLSDDEAVQFVRAYDGKVCALAHVDRNGYLVNGKCQAEYARTLGRIVAVPFDARQQVESKIQQADKRAATLRRLLELIRSRS